MEKIQILIISLLVIAIVFSIISVALNFSLSDLKNIQFKIPTKTVSVPKGNPQGNINLIVEGAPGK
jgi:hypothetical protein